MLAEIVVSRTGRRAVRRDPKAGIPPIDPRGMSIFFGTEKWTEKQGR